MKGENKIRWGANGIESFWKLNKGSNKALQALSYFIVIFFLYLFHRYLVDIKVASLVLSNIFCYCLRSQLKL